MATLNSLSDGTYVLVNAKGGTALDLEGDGVKLAGYPLHYGKNQQWKFVNTGLGWAIKSCHELKDGTVFYLSIAGGRLAEHTRLTPSTVPVNWDLALIDGALRIIWPGTHFVVELVWAGDPKPGTEISITWIRPGDRCQLWHFAHCGAHPARSHVEDTRMTEHAHKGALPPTMHVLTHVHQDVALELDGASRRSVKHRAAHKEPSQLWKLIVNGDEEVIQACRGSLDDEPLYLSVEGRAKRNATVVASPYPVGWRIERSAFIDGKRTLRIFWPRTNLVISAQKSADGDNVVLADCDDTVLSKWSDITI